MHRMRIVKAGIPIHQARTIEVFRELYHALWMLQV